MKRTLDASKLLRRLIQMSFALIVLYVGFGRQLNWKVPTIDALCPFGAVEGLWYVITSGRYLGKLFPSNMIIGFALLISVLIVGGSFCGWVCPFGSLQDFLSYLRKTLKIREIQIAQNIEKYLSYTRYLVLILILFFTIITTDLIFSKICPYRTIFGVEWLFKPSLTNWLAYGIALFILISSFFVNRFWCKVLCPLGGLISIFSKFSLIKVRRNEDTCTGCNLCKSNCHLNLSPHMGKNPGSNCDMCLECTKICPIDSTLVPSLPIKNIVTSKFLSLSPLFVVVIFSGIIFITNIFGIWSTSGKSNIFYSSIATGQLLNPEDIRGWMSLEDIYAATGVPISYIYEQTKLSSNIPTSTALRDLEKISNIDTADIRAVITQYYNDNPEHQPPTEINFNALSKNSGSTELKGNISLAEISIRYSIPLEILLEELDLPKDIPSRSTLQMLKIEVSKVNRIIEQYNQ